MEQIAFLTGSVAFLGASFLIEMRILKCIVSKDLPTVNSDLSFEGDPWDAGLSLLQQQRSPRAAGCLLERAAMAKSRGAGAGRPCQCARSGKQKAGHTLEFLGLGGRLCWEERHIQEGR